MSGAKSRNKGKRGELEVVRMIRDNLGIECNRNYKQVAQAQHGDIEQLIGPFLVEAKNCARIDLKSWWKQASAAAAAHPARPMPCVAYKVARKGWLFVVPMAEAWNSGQQWGREVQYTQTLFPDGFFLLVREHMG